MRPQQQEKRDARSGRSETHTERECRVQSESARETKETRAVRTSELRTVAAAAAILALKQSQRELSD